MKLGNLLPGVILISFVLIISACGGGKPSSASGTMDNTSATLLAGQYGQQIAAGASPNPSDSIGSMASGMGNIARNRIVHLLSKRPEFRPLAEHIDQIVRSTNCDPTWSSTTDADGDGIYANATASFTCNLTQTGL